MNYLAHSYFSPPDPDILCGNLIADMLKGNERKTIAPQFLPGLRLHYFIDSFTDRHEGLKVVKRQLRTDFGKYAPVVADVYMDFILATAWDSISSVSYQMHTAYVYTCLQAGLDLLPAAIQPRLMHMVQSDWLSIYLYPQSLERIFTNLRKRASHPQLLHKGLEIYERDNEIYLPVFLLFFRDLQQAVMLYQNQ